MRRKLQVSAAVGLVAGIAAAVLLLTGLDAVLAAATVAGLAAGLTFLVLTARGSNVGARLDHLEARQAAALEAMRREVATLNERLERQSDGS